MKKILCAWLTFGLVVPSPASLAPQPDRPLRMGVIRFDDEAPVRQTSVAGERRLGRWLENLDQLSIRAETLPPVRASQRGEDETSCDRLKGLLEACQTALTLTDTDPPPSCTALASRAEQSARQGQCGLEVQKSWVLESTLAFRKGDSVRQTQLIRRAVTLHPHGFLASPFEWEKEPRGFNAAQFWGAVKAVKEGLVRDCRIDVKDAETYDAIYLNGFAMEPGSRWQLHRQGQWHVLAKRGDRAFRGLASCRAPQALRQGLDLQREDKQFALRSQLAEVAQSRNLDSLLVVQPVHEQVRLFLYQSQDARLLEIPLEKPISVREWERQRGDGGFPIAQEKLVALLNGGLREASDAGSVSAPATLDMRVGGDNEKWYNSSTFWWVTAGVAAGVATIFLITQNGQVRPNPSIRVELP